MSRAIQSVDSSSLPDDYGLLEHGGHDQTSEPIRDDDPWTTQQEHQAVATRQKPAEGFLRCVAARPDERDAEEDGRHFGRNDRWMLGHAEGVEAQNGFNGGANLGQTVAFDGKRNDANKNLQRDSSLRGGASRGTGCKKRQAATSSQNDAALQTAALVCGTVRGAGLKKSQALRMTRGFRTLRWFASWCDGLR